MNEYTDATQRKVSELTGRELEKFLWECGSTRGKKGVIVFPNEDAAEAFNRAASMAFDRVYYRISAIWPRTIEFHNGSEIALKVCTDVFVNTSQYDKVFYYSNREYADEPFDSDNEILDAYLKSFAIITDTV